MYKLEEIKSILLDTNNTLLDIRDSLNESDGMECFQVHLNFLISFIDLVNINNPKQDKNKIIGQLTNFYYMVMNSLNVDVMDISSKEKDLRFFIFSTLLVRCMLEYGDTVFRKDLLENYDITPIIKDKYKLKSFYTILSLYNYLADETTRRNRIKSLDMDEVFDRHIMDISTNLVDRIYKYFKGY